MRFVIQRHHEVKDVQKNGLPEKEDATVGIANLYTETGRSIFSCFTIENGGASSSEADQDKRIMPGEYRLEWSVTKAPIPSDFKEGLLVVHPEIKKFRKRRILIHMGNFPHDTKGCILLNSTYNLVTRPGYGQKSLDATRTFYNIISKIELKLFILEIKEIQ